PGRQESQFPYKTCWALPVRMVPILEVCVGGSRPVVEWLDSAKSRHSSQSLENRLMSRNLAMGIAMITIGAVAVAGQQQSPVVLVQYVVGEKSPDVVEEVLTSPIERSVRNLRRVTGLRSTTGNSGTGVAVAVEISFEGGATSLDLEAVLRQVSQLKTKGNVEVASVTVQLMQPHKDNDAGRIQR
ncbi:MAG: hypothetical protein M3Y65_02745, partial [Pseudomonadota bacterium]|nr:hypothetical protein [Pseudomonadota bacterium]